MQTHHTLFYSFTWIFNLPVMSFNYLGTYYKFVYSKLLGSYMPIIFNIFQKVDLFKECNSFFRNLETVLWNWTFDSAFEILKVVVLRNFSNWWYLVFTSSLHKYPRGEKTQGDCSILSWWSAMPFTFKKYIWPTEWPTKWQYIIHCTGITGWICFSLIEMYSNRLFFPRRQFSAKFVQEMMFPKDVVANQLVTAEFSRTPMHGWNI